MKVLFHYNSVRQKILSETDRILYEIDNSFSTTRLTNKECIVLTFQGVLDKANHLRNAIKGSWRSG